MVSAHVPTSLNESQVSHVRQDYRARSRSSRKPCESPFTFPPCSRPLALVLLRTKKKDISTVREEMIEEKSRKKKEKKKKRLRCSVHGSEIGYVMRGNIAMHD